MKFKKIKKGDLIETINGNVAIVLDSCHIEKNWSDIMFLRSGHIRYGFFNGNIGRVLNASR